jgi:hypothetical protein
VCSGHHFGRVDSILTVSRLVISAWLLLAGAAAPAQGAGASDRIRSTDGLIQMLLEEGRQRSATFRDLVDTIDRTDGIVYVERGRCPVGGMRACLLHVLTPNRHARYLWIAVDTSARRGELIAVMAHELQHAAEVLHAPSVRTGRDILNFYRSVDALHALGVTTRSEGRAYETAAAILTADTVRADLAAQPSDAAWQAR